MCYTLVVNEGRITYLTGVSNDITRDCTRDDLGLLATPAGGIYAQRHRYPVWAADNAMFTAPDATWHDVRYGELVKEEARWVRWIEKIDPDGCLWATLPDVVGDAVATWERSAKYVVKVRNLGFKVAIVLQNGIENEPFIWKSILNAADAVFLGGSPECVPCGYVRPAKEHTIKVCPECDEKLTEWKLGPAAAELVAEAKARGLMVHMGRVNSRKRLQYAADIGCDSADGTYIGFAPKVNAPKVIDVWLPGVNDAEPELALAA